MDQITDVDEYKDNIDTFYVKKKILRYRDDGPPRTEPLDSDEIQCSRETRDEGFAATRKREAYSDRGQKAKAMEICCGVGGMSTGLCSCGAIDPKWAIEFAPAAAATFKRNSPDTIVYNEDASACLARALRQEAGVEKNEEEKDISGMPVQAMPGPGEVDLLVAGFPCPGYSSINAHQKADDLRNTLIALVLSYVDFYRPAYVLLENVQALLNHKVCLVLFNRFVASLLTAGSWVHGKTARSLKGELNKGR